MPTKDSQKPYIQTKKDDSTVCAYWKCSKEKRLYLQKYIRQNDGSYLPAGVYKLDQGTGAFPLENLEQYQSDGEAVSLQNGFDPCPYCGSNGLVLCECQKTFCDGVRDMFGNIKCPWCGKTFQTTPGDWNVGGGG